MANTINGDGPASLQMQLEAFRQSDVQRNQLFQHMIEAYYKLQQRYEEKVNDWDNEQASRRHWQSLLAETKRDLQLLRQRTDSNQFVLVLIDGDGAIFQDHLLKAGTDGGSEAAHYLFEEIKKHLNEAIELTGQWSIMVQIFANLDGLSRKLAQVGILKSPSELHAFARAFNISQSMFSFIDCGVGKERADHKIKEMFRLFVSNVQCKHIVFGGCHDNGYIPNLEPYKRDDNVRSRMSLLETTPATRQYTQLGFPIICFPSVFRKEPLPDFTGASLYQAADARSFPSYQAFESTLSQPYQPPLLRSNLSYQAPAFTPQSTTHANVNASEHVPQGNLFSPPSSSPVPTSATIVKQLPTANTALPSPAPSSRVPLPIAATASAPSTFASISKLDSDTKQISIAPSKPVQRKTILLNIHDQRLDPKLLKPDFLAMQNLNKRIKEQKVCNNYHLMGKCRDGDQCQYQHGERLGAKEQVALRTKARERVCPQRSGCRDIDCFSGHHCPREPCIWDGCYFDDLHDLDSVVRMKMYEDGQIEIVN